MVFTVGQSQEMAVFFYWCIFYLWNFFFNLLNSDFSSLPSWGSSVYMQPELHTTQSNHMLIWGQESTSFHCHLGHSTPKCRYIPILLNKLVVYCAKFACVSIASRGFHLYLISEELLHKRIHFHRAEKPMRSYEAWEAMLQNIITCQQQAVLYSSNNSAWVNYHFTRLYEKQV